MTASMLNPIFVSAIVLLVLVVWILRSKVRRGDVNWLPRELRTAELVYAEELFRSGGDVPIVAKCDRGYRTTSGVIVLVELKTRKLNRVYPSDIIELSAQRFAIYSQTGQSVSQNGYVLIQNPENSFRTSHKVKLLEDTVVIALAKRRVDILTGDAPANFSCSKGLYKKCAYRLECR